MFRNVSFYFEWWSLFLEIAAYSLVTSIVLLGVFFLLLVTAKMAVPIAIESGYYGYILLFCVISMLVGVFAYILGVMSSLSRSAGNPAIISALIPAFSVAILYFKERSLTTIVFYVLLSMIFIVNIFSGVYFGSALRFQSTESIGALQSQALREFQIRQFRKNLDLPVKGGAGATKGQ